jgi:hypothetical protein
VEPIVPVSSSTGTKYCDWPEPEPDVVAGGAGNVVMVTGFEEMERPVPYKPTSLIGDGLQVGGWQMA